MNCTVPPHGLQACWPSIVMARKVIIDARSDRSYPLSSQYPQSNHFIGNTSAVGFVDFTRGNYRLMDKSPYKGRGTNGKDPGVDFNALDGVSPPSRSIGVATSGQSEVIQLDDDDLQQPLDLTTEIGFRLNPSCESLRMKS